MWAPGTRASSAPSHCGSRSPGQACSGELPSPRRDDGPTRLEALCFPGQPTTRIGPPQHLVELRATATLSPSSTPGASLAIQPGGHSPPELCLPHSSQPCPGWGHWAEAGAFVFISAGGSTRHCPGAGGAAGERRSVAGSRVAHGHHRAGRCWRLQDSTDPSLLGFFEGFCFFFFFYKKLSVSNDETIFLPVVELATLGGFLARAAKVRLPRGPLGPLVSNLSQLSVCERLLGLASQRILERGPVRRCSSCEGPALPSGTHWFQTV